MADLLFVGGYGGIELVVLLMVMIPGMLAIYLVLKHEKNEIIPIWILAIFLIPFVGSMIYLMKYFIKDKRRSL